MRSHVPEEFIFESNPGERTRPAQDALFGRDHGLRVHIQAGAVGAEVVSGAQKDPVTNMWSMTIRNTRWDEEYSRRRGRR